ncbi:hypothetical protein FNV43_RR23151 [Rhamnella rubrinervis]|uniref:Uncharacterized protein n=1 Tax=Rhamnella rubrinervis TaxID=2594499 RepID=A0A8K0GRT0_9ROSA|nr:hypothetical protein FNV43_RR23151 [Rhamnella rubrinervis]
MVEEKMGKKRKIQGTLWPFSLVKAAPSLHKLSLKVEGNPIARSTRQYHVDKETNSEKKWPIGVPCDEVVGMKLSSNRVAIPCVVVELIGYSGVRYEIQHVVDLVEIAASFEKLVIHVCVPTMYWR